MGTKRSQVESADGIYFRRGKQCVSRCLHRWNASVYTYAILVKILILTKGIDLVDAVRKEVVILEKSWKKIIIGIVTGFANGLFGSGGGTIVVPAMERFLGEEEHKAHATAIAIILPLSVLSLVIYLWKTDLGTVWKTALWASTGGLVGGIVGARLLRKVSGIWLHRIFGGFMLAAAVRMLL